jgi:hypothetical protein
MFGILFSIPEGRRPTQGTYKLDHEQLGSFELFLVPVTDNGNVAYEAVFNRLKKKTK